jgi:hypothetical protein
VKIKAVLEMTLPRNLKELQRLTGMVMTFNKSYVGQLTSVYLSSRCFEALDWTKEYDKAFQDLKVYLTNSSLLSRTVEGKPLYSYLAVLSTTVRLVLLKEDDGLVYPKIEKLAFALVTLARGFAYASKPTL